ncbi:MAG: aspartate kinase [Candidatus Aenigmarchaeota archaeon]|nr:aspartate kinase [Candidatus Aenigmarchaeota archaeon]
MVDIYKYSNKAIQGFDDLDRIAKLAKDKKDDGLVIVTADLDNTTDKLADAVYFGNHRNPEEIFEAYYEFVEKIGNRNLTKIFEDARGWLNAGKLMRHGERSHNTDEIQLSLGDRLTAYIVHTYLGECGIESSHIDALNGKRFPLQLRKRRKPTETEIDMENSKRTVESLDFKNGVLVLPGYVAVNQDNFIRTLGRGGGDIASIAYADLFGADSVNIVDEDALTISPLSESIVDEINLDEAWGAGFFGARLKTHKSIKYLKSFFDHYPESKAFITGKDIGLRKTRINPYAEEQSVRFIAARDIDRYGIMGNYIGLMNQLRKALTVDWFPYGEIEDEGVGIGVFERGREVAQSIIKKMFQEGEIEIVHFDRAVYLGIVGSGMSRGKGIAGRAYNALRGINLEVSNDPRGYEPKSKYIAVMIKPEDEMRALKALEKEFFGN